MTSEKRDDEIAERVAAYMDASLDSIDGSASARLRQSRLNALQVLENRKPWFQMPRVWLPPALLSSLAICVLAISVWFFGPGSGLKNLPLDDIEVVTSVEQQELIQDLEFFQWLQDTDYGRLKRDNNS